MAPSLSFTYTGASPLTIDGDGPAFEVTWLLDLYDFGPSVGANLPTDGADGTVARDRKRDELAAEITWRITGVEDLAGTIATNRYRQMRLNIRDLQEWFDSAPGRQVDVTLTDDTLTLEGTGQHELFGDLEWHGLYVVRRQLLTFNAGALSEAA